MTKNILGLDLGTNSIGWALIEVDENNIPIRIIAMGSRIIPLTTSDKEEFQRGLSITKNHSRTVSRTQRKGYDRKQLKKSDLKKLLIKYFLYICNRKTIHNKAISRRKSMSCVLP